MKYFCFAMGFVEIIFFIDANKKPLLQNCKRGDVVKCAYLHCKQRGNAYSEEEEDAANENQ